MPPQLDSRYSLTMQPFRLTLANNGTVTGAHSIPSPSSSPVQHRPLIIGLHGGCYDHQYFDALPEYSASVASKAFGIPFVAIDRPSYGGTSCVLPIPDGSDFTQESAKLLHLFILPRLWTEFGAPNGCNCIVLLSHSLGVMVGIAVAAMHAQDGDSAYPLGGLIASGMGDVQSKAMQGTTPSYPKVDETHAVCPVDIKDALMFKPNTYAPEMLQQSKRLNAICPIPELIGFATDGCPCGKRSGLHLSRHRSCFHWSRMIHFSRRMRKRLIVVFAHSRIVYAWTEVFCAALRTVSN